LSLIKSFGERLARLRQEAGLSQRDLAAEVNISQRMVAYYEKQTTHPPTHLLPLLAKALGVSSDQLLGINEVKAMAGRKTIASCVASARSNNSRSLNANRSSRSSAPSSNVRS